MADKNNYNNIDILKLFDDCIKESICCTEPVAVGLSVSTAFNAVNGILPVWLNYEKINTGTIIKDDKQHKLEDIKRVVVEVDRDTYKNSLQVKIPYTNGLNGAKMAAALGLFCNPNNKLELYKDLTQKKVLKAVDMVNKGKIEVIPNLSWDNICIKSKVFLSGLVGDTIGISHIIGEHSNIVYIAVNNRVLFRRTINEIDSNLDRLKSLKLIDLIHIVENLHPESRKKIKKAIEVNNNAVYDVIHTFKEYKETNFYHVMNDFLDTGYLADDLINRAKNKVAVAIEGRMSGLDIKVMTCAGSGNVGLTTTLPLITIAERLGKYDDKFENAADIDDKLIKSVGLAYLVANYVNMWTGYLSALCGCAVKAGIGATAGITYYLLDDDLNDLEKVEIVGTAINIMSSTVVGLICDGSRRECALKAAMVTGSAISSAFLALKGIKHHGGGITDIDPLVTIKNIGSISKGMIETDKIILKILEEMKDEYRSN